jgi:endonuclease/exonuclease/phosphatase family metal-dependent hydrolase
MSFNIRTTASESNPVNNWDNRKPAVVNFINTCGADIIGMQEVRQVQYDYIKANASSNYTVLYFPRESGSNPEGLAFAYDNTKFEFVSSEKYWLSETPETQSYGWGESYYRIAVVLILKHIETGEIIKSINTHGPLQDVANTNAYELVMERSVNDGDPFIFLCGDFNAHPDEIGYIPVAKELQDCRVTADDKTESAYTTFNSWGGYTNDNPQIIDFCFVSKGDHVDVKTYDVRQDTWGDGNLLSDHYAVQSVVEITYKTNIPDQSGNGFDGEIDPA